jgi:hypothetical protein
MQRALNEHGMNARQLAKELDRGDGTKGWAYDYIRKLSKGQIFPGVPATKAICDYFNLDFEELWKKIQIERGIDKGIVLPDEDKLLLGVQRYWDYLNDVDKEEVLSQVKHRAEMRTKKFNSSH